MDLVTCLYTRECRVSLFSDCSRTLPEIGIGRGGCHRDALKDAPQPPLTTVSVFAVIEDDMRLSTALTRRMTMTPYSEPPPVEKGSHYIDATRLASRLLMFVIVALFLMSGGSLIYLSLAVDEDQLAHDKSDVSLALNSRLEQIAIALDDYAFWIDSYDYTYGEVDHEWAYERDNIGASLYPTYGLNGVFIVGPAGATRYALINGELTDIKVEEWIQSDLPRLLEKAREGSLEDEVASEYTAVNGVPAVVSAAVIRPDSSYVQFETLSYLLYVDILDATKLAALADSYDLKGLRAGIGAGEGLEEPYVILASEEVGDIVVQWQKTAYGQNILIKVLPIWVLVGGLVLFLLIWLRKRINHASKVVDEVQGSLKVSEQRFKNLSEISSDWIWQSDTDQVLVYLSERFEPLTGLSTSAWIGRPLSELLQYNASTLVAIATRGAAAGRQPIECELRDGEGRVRYCQIFASEFRVGGELKGYQGTVCDITREMEAKAKIEHISQHDPLTGLANRHRLDRFLGEKLSTEVSGDHPLFVLALDLDRFKPVNDTYGHAVGDQVLREIAKAIQGCIEDRDMVARLGGDEFIVVATQCKTSQDAARLGQCLIDKINQPIPIGNHVIHVGTSIGIVAAPYHALTHDAMLRGADIALYEAKSQGRNVACIYDPSMSERIMERRQLEMDLCQAVARKELRLEFQPRFDAMTQGIIGAEALVRWHHPIRGVLSPACFIPVAEENGVIFEISDWVLREACWNAMSWENELWVSVNLSPVEFQRHDLVQRIQRVLEETGLSAERLELEITENIVREDSEAILTTMSDLKALGVRLSMDNFGTDYSSLGYLQSYPFDGIKIDRSFLMYLDHSERHEAVVDAIIRMGHALSLNVTIGGVETTEQLERVSSLSCDQVQGFYLGPPISPASFKELVCDGVCR